MLLTITLDRPPAAADQPRRTARDLGYLVVKHPDRVHTRDLAFGKVHVFFPEASEECTTVALLLEVDTIGVVKSGSTALEDYVNDRAYVASSFMSVAISKALGTALAGRCESHQDLADARLPLRARLAVVPCRAGEALLRALFEPLGYEVDVVSHPLDPQWPEWGTGWHHTLTLRADVRLRDLLHHLYVLLPVVDGSKHYWADAAEVDKLLKHGAGWLPVHPQRRLIAERYLRHQPAAARKALAEFRLADLARAEPDPAADGDDEGDGPELEEDPAALMAMIEERRKQPTMSSAEARAALGLPGPGLESLEGCRATVESIAERLCVPGPEAPAAPVAPSAPRPRLGDQRLEAVARALLDARARTVLDLGCGPGRLLARLAGETSITRLVGVDGSDLALEHARRRLRLDRARSGDGPARIELLEGLLTYRDPRLAGFDAAAVVEVVEHIDPERLGAFARALFGEARPGTIVLTTPNREYNVLFPFLAAGTLRHKDHRFEWTRAEFRAWAEPVAGRHGYEVAFSGIGTEDPVHGAPTQMAVFTRTPCAP
jgi:SAM-dependent methyltransferase